MFVLRLERPRVGTRSLFPCPPSEVFASLTKTRNNQTNATLPLTMCSHIASLHLPTSDAITEVSLNAQFECAAFLVESAAYQHHQTPRSGDAYRRAHGPAVYTKACTMVRKNIIAWRRRAIYVFWNSLLLHNSREP